MKALEIIEKIEEVIQNKIQETGQDNESTDQQQQSAVKEIILLVVSFFLDLMKAPFKFMARYFLKETITFAKKDARLYAFIMGMMGVLFVFFSVLWLFVSVAVGVYFYEQGDSALISILWSVLFQIISFIVIGLMAWIAFRRIRSLKMMKNILGGVAK